MTDVVGGLRAHVKGLRRYAMALTRDPELVDDLVQETLRRALTYSRKGREIRDLRAYLFTILHNVRVDELTQNGKSGKVVPITENAVQLTCLPTQDLRIECREVSEALSLLSEEQREVILLIALEGLSYRDTAEILGVPIGTVMSRLNRGREALRSMMTEGQSRNSRKAM